VILSCNFDWDLSISTDGASSFWTFDPTFDLSITSFSSWLIESNFNVTSPWWLVILSCISDWDLSISIDGASCWCVVGWELLSLSKEVSFWSVDPNFSSSMTSFLPCFFGSGGDFSSSSAESQTIAFINEIWWPSFTKTLESQWDPSRICSGVIVWNLLNILPIRLQDSIFCAIKLSSSLGSSFRHKLLCKCFELRGSFPRSWMDW